MQYIVEPTDCRKRAVSIVTVQCTKVQCKYSKLPQRNRIVKGVDALIELSDLTYLVAVQDKGTLSAVAKALHISQPVLTRRMQKLEEKFGVPLFERRKNRIALNADGILAAGYARKILLQAQNMVELVRTQAQVRSTILLDSNAPGPMLELMQRMLKNYPGMIVSMNRNYVRIQNSLSIGACSYIPVLELLEHITRNYPELQVTVEVKDEKFLPDELASGRYRTVILPQELRSPDLVCRPCGQEHFFAALPQNHPLAVRQSVSLTELDGEKMLVFPGNEAWLSIAKDRMPHSSFSSQPMSDLMEELYRTPELPFFTSDILDRQLGHPKDRVLIPLADAEASVTYYAAYKKSDESRLEKLFHP